MPQTKKIAPDQPITDDRHAKKRKNILGSDYDRRTFCLNQAFFPGSSAWDKIARALKSSIDPERFAAFSGTRSLPFPVGGYKRVAVKVIDPRGNEAIRVLSVGGS